MHFLSCAPLQLFATFAKDRAVLRGAKMFCSKDIPLTPSIEFVDDDKIFVHGFLCTPNERPVAPAPAEAEEDGAPPLGPRAPKTPAEQQQNDLNISVVSIAQIFAQWGLQPRRTIQTVTRVSDGASVEAYVYVITPQELARLDSDGEEVDASPSVQALAALTPLPSGSWLTRPRTTAWICHNCTDANESYAGDPTEAEAVSGESDGPPLSSGGNARCICNTCGEPMRAALAAGYASSSAADAKGAGKTLASSDLGMHASTSLSAIAEMAGAPADVVAALLSTVGTQSHRRHRRANEPAGRVGPAEGPQSTCFAYDPRMLLHKTLGTDALGHPLLPGADAASADAGADAAVAAVAETDADAAEEGAVTRTPLQAAVATVRAEERAAMAGGALQRAVQKASMHPERPTRLLSIVTHLAREGILQQCTRVAARYATDREILAVHAEGHLSLVRHVIRKAGGTDVEGAEEGAAQSLSPGGGSERLKLRLANNLQSDADASAADGETEGDPEAAGGDRESSAVRHKRARREHGSYEGNASDESALVAGFASHEGGAADDFDSATGGGADVARLSRARAPSDVAMRPPEAPPAKRARTHGVATSANAVVSSGAEGDGDESAVEGGGRPKLGAPRGARGGLHRGGLESGAEGDESAAEFIGQPRKGVEPLPPVPGAADAAAAAPSANAAADGAAGAAGAAVRDVRDVRDASSECEDGADSNGSGDDGGDVSSDASQPPSEGEEAMFGAQWKDVYKNAESLKAARLSAGTVCAVTEAVIKGTAANGLALVRPPGHHAECSCVMGFCVFNNVAIAAQMALDKYGLKRILIMDWDVHHGNGTQVRCHCSCWWWWRRCLAIVKHRARHRSPSPAPLSLSPSLALSLSLALRHIHDAHTPFTSHLTIARV